MNKNEIEVVNLKVFKSSAKSKKKVQIISIIVESLTLKLTMA